MTDLTYLRALPGGEKWQNGLCMRLRWCCGLERAIECLSSENVVKDARSWGLALKMIGSQVTLSSEGPEKFLMEPCFSHERGLPTGRHDPEASLASCLAMPSLAFAYTPSAICHGMQPRGPSLLLSQGWHHALEAPKL